MFGWVESVRPSDGDRAARVLSLAEAVRSFGRVQAARIFDLAEGVQTFGREQAARIFDLAEGVQTFGREQAARLLGWGGAEVDARTKLLDRMIVLIVHGLRTKTYEQFVATFSNPGHEPDALQRLSHKANFQMRISPTCWYDANVSYGRDGTRSLRIVGGGDDLGVCITAGSAIDGMNVEYTAQYGEESGRDAWAMVRALAKFPAYHRVSPAETSLEI
jgi:hypothetical protein